MAGRLLAVLILPLGVLALVTVAARAYAANRLEGAARVARLRAVVASTLTVLVTILIAMFSPWPSSDDVRLATVPALAALAGVLFAGLAELTWPRPQGEVREASITVRRGTTATTLRRLFVGSALLSAGLLAVGALTAAPDGRSVERSWSLGSVGAGPYPGMAYAVPIGLALGALGLGTWWALGRVDARPALGSGLEEVDRAIRTGAYVRVLRVAAAGSLLTAAGLAASMGTALANLAMNLRMNWEAAPRAPWDWTQNAGFGLIALAVACGIATVYALFFDSPRVPGLERTLPAPAGS